MGWPSFEGREASSKIAFEDELREIDRDQQVGRVSGYLYTGSAQSSPLKKYYL